jgi:formiminotetrahydrofolate cyclodeaminase
MSEHDFRSPAVETFLDGLGSDSPTPGGGTGAAIAAAMGAALVQMLAELTLGRKRYADHEELMRAIAEQAAAERGTLLDLAAKDAGAYDAVGAAFKLPKQTDAEQAARRDAIQTALKGACEVPLEVMQHCLEVISLAKHAVQRGNVNAVSDGAAGAELCRAGMRIAGYNVKINLGSIKDEEYVKNARTRMDEMAYMGTAVANEIDSHVNELWQSSGS